MTVYKLLVHSARQIVQVVSNKEQVLTGDRMKQISCMERQQGSTGSSIVVDSCGLIDSIGTDEEINDRYKDDSFQQIVDAGGKCLIPGFVDGHTHPVWVGDRVHEFAMKPLFTPREQLGGATYMEVHAAGGGIMFTVDHVRRATEDELYADFTLYARRMLEAGTTLAECKSGYGLDAATEMKMLHVLERARRDPDVALEISATYCGAHAVPKGSTSEEATTDVLNIQLPLLKSLMDSGDLHVDNIDVFCERGVYDVDQTRRILISGREMGLHINFHGEELHRLHSAEMGASLGARAISHLEEVSEEGVAAMARSGTVAVVLPTTAHVLRLTPPPVRDMVAAGVPVALGSDFNPNAHCMAMPVVLHLACVLLRLSLPEALVAATLNAAASLGRAATQGSLEVGKMADMILIDAPRWEHIVYQLGSHQYLIEMVIKGGKIVHQRK